MYAVTVTILFRFYIKPRIQNREKLKNLRRRNMKLLKDYNILASQ